ncbi:MULTISPECIES: DUF2796 domain-containing protein [Pseudomonas]|uniref:DUF2796 domain-containing protein n=1 Tax=Serpens gallinarum TaxID=2763075 RepID=A0ABR8TT49_9PSED|nr:MULTISPECIES: DUF2796 domain-containing protein [Pseudomonas]MBD7978955.1 DUF2796 domain-containing protein [Serpens gallinarum]MBF0676456.1 DUF2796 domain-containing protein [Pseudomonas sp.]
MRRLLLVVLPLSLVSPLANALTHHDDDDAYGNASLHAHEHGVAQLDVALEGKQLELEIHSPAINLLGFEHFPKNTAEEARVEAVRELLEQPRILFSLPAMAKCEAERQAINSPLFGVAAGDVDHLALHDDEDALADTAEQEHAEIHAHYQFDCAKPDALQGLDLSPLFRQFPGTRRIQVQLIGPKGQQGHEVTRSQPRLSF